METYFKYQVNKFSLSAVEHTTLRAIKYLVRSAMCESDYSPPFWAGSCSNHFPSCRNSSSRNHLLSSKRNHRTANPTWFNWLRCCSAPALSLVPIDYENFIIVSYMLSSSRNQHQTLDKFVQLTCPNLAAKWRGVQKLQSAGWGSAPFFSNTDTTSR